MELITIGYNFKTSSIEERECWTLQPERLHPFLKRLLENPSVSGVVYLATCNRVELYVTAKQAMNLEVILGHWAQFLKTPGKSVIPGYVFKNEAAFAHLIRVCSGLDSLVVGEPQVLGQVKQAYFQAMEMGVTDALTNFVFQQAFRYAKKVRTETGIAKYPVSIGSVALMLAEEIFGNFSALFALVVGLGKMGEQTAELLSKRNVGNLMVTNRTHDTAVSFAKKISAEACRFETLAEVLQRADLVVTCTSASAPLLTRELFVKKEMLQKKNPTVLIDLGVPRDVEPEVGNLQNLFLYNVDDLKIIAEKNLALRLEEARLADQIIQKAAGKFNIDWKKRSGSEGRVAHLVRVLP